MKCIPLALLAGALTLLCALAQAATIGVSMALFDDNFLTVVRTSMQSRAQQLNVGIQFEDAQNDIGRQLNQIQNFIAQKVDAIIVNPVDTDATPRMTRLAVAARIPLVYVNRLPADIVLGVFELDGGIELLRPRFHAGAHDGEEVVVEQRHGDADRGGLRGSTGQCQRAGEECERNAFHATKCKRRTAAMR